MSLDPTRARATIDTWREQQADRLDPIRFRFIDALERRTASRDGELRRVLDERLSLLLSGYAEDLATATLSGQRSPIPSRPSRRPLGELLDHLASTSSKREGEVAVFNLTPGSSELPVLPALDDFRKTWSAVRSESQLRQSLAFVPTNAGPLNSAALVHRSIALMRELSPGYLQHFLAYVDDLSWLEQLSASVGSKTVARPASRKKRTRKKSGGMAPENVE
jgi:hypothetical protein